VLDKFFCCDAANDILFPENIFDRGAEANLPA